MNSFGLYRRVGAAAIMALVLAACAPAPTRDAGPPSSEPEAGEPKPAEPEPGEAEPTAPEPSEPELSEPKPFEPKPSEPEPTGPESPEPEPVEPEPVDSQPTGAKPAEPETPKPAEPPPSGTVSIGGRLRMTGGDADPAEAVVYYLAREQDAAPAPASQPYEIITADKALRPTVMAVPKGATMRFPNQDPILHNLFSVSSSNAFDLGVYGPGDAPTATLEVPGVVNIYCNVHHDMHAHVLVLDSPYFTRPDDQGRFELTGLPRGSGRLHVWHRQADRWSRTVELPVTHPLAIELEVTKPSLPPHRDKAGQSYQRRDRDPYR